MNRIDYSVEVTITKNNKEKTFDLPFVCDNQLWFQLFKTASSTTHNIKLPISNISIQN